MYHGVADTPLVGLADGLLAEAPHLRGVGRWAPPDSGRGGRTLKGSESVQRSEFVKFLPYFSGRALWSERSRTSLRKMASRRKASGPWRARSRRTARRAAGGSVPATSVKEGAGPGSDGRVGGV